MVLRNNKNASEELINILCESTSLKALKDNIDNLIKIYGENSSIDIYANTYGRCGDYDSCGAEIQTSFYPEKTPQ